MMKLAFNELQKLYKEIGTAIDVKRDEDGFVVSFRYRKYYTKKNSGSRLIRVMLKSEKELKKLVYTDLDELEFFNRLVDNIGLVTNVKINNGKIYKYTLRGEKFKTEKCTQKKLFDYIPYKEFKKITNQRFWTNDKILRAGYFSGLIGTNNANIDIYNKKRGNYDLYDVDFNAAYPYCLNMFLPCGRFHTLEQWEKVGHDYDTFMSFYEIKIKCLKNPFGIFVAPMPYVQYADFDFLLAKSGSSMIVSEKRLDLIRLVYGIDSFIITNEYKCATKKYHNLAQLSNTLYEKIQKEKADGNYDNQLRLKIALNSLIGCLGKRDETRGVKNLEVIDSGVLKDVVRINWTKSTEKEQPNYLPLSMVVNDITACRLFDLLTSRGVMRLCYNTDGGIIAIDKNIQIETSGNIGMLKAKKIHSPIFLECSQLYNRPLIKDLENNEVYNSKSIYFNADLNCFMYSEDNTYNTRKGFIRFETTYPVATSKWNGFNFRENEVLIKINSTKEHKKIIKNKAVDNIEELELKSLDYELQKLCNPYDSNYNKIRHAPKRDSAVQENFFKIVDNIEIK